MLKNILLSVGLFSLSVVQADAQKASTQNQKNAFLENEKSEKKETLIARLVRWFRGVHTTARRNGHNTPYISSVYYNNEEVIKYAPGYHAKEEQRLEKLRQNQKKNVIKEEDALDTRIIRKLVKMVMIPVRAIFTNKQGQ